MFTLNNFTAIGRVVYVSQIRESQVQNGSFYAASVGLALKDHTGKDSGIVNLELFNGAIARFLLADPVGLRIYIESELTVTSSNDKKQSFHNFSMKKWQFVDGRDVNDNLRARRAAQGKSSFPKDLTIEKLQAMFPKEVADFNAKKAARANQSAQQQPTAQNFQQAQQQFGQAPMQNNGFQQQAPVQNFQQAPMQNQGFQQPAQQQFGQAPAADYSHPAYSQEPEAGFGAMPQDGNFGF